MTEYTFLLYRLAVVSVWPQSALKTATLDAIKYRLFSERGLTGPYHNPLER